MKFGAASLGPITNHASYCGTNPTEALLLRDKPLHLSCGLDAKILVSRGKMFQGLRRHKQAFSLTFIVSAIRNGKDEHESIIGAYSDDQSLTISKSSHKANDTTKESVASSLYLSEDHSQHAKILENHGNLLDKLKAIHMHALAMEQWNASRLKQCHRRHAMSAANLIHYLALRSLDVDQIKDDLSSVGLLNLETINPYVIASLSAGIQMLENLKSTSLDGNDKGITSDKSEFTRSMMIDKANSNRDFLIGPLQDERTHIMVTVGREAISNETFINDVLKTGATIIRINCAHGDPSVWSEIIRRVKMNSQMLEKPCRILMDLAGPKLRTGKMKPGPCVLKISPKKNAHGNMINPAHVWIAPKGAGPPPSHVSPDAVLYVDAQDFLTKLEIGDTIKFSDARGKKRSLKISKKFPVFNGVGFMADCTKTCYVENGMELYIKANKKRASFGCVVDVPPTETFVRLRVGDLLVITRDSSNEELTSSKAGTPRVTCSSGYLFDSVKPGEPIAFDDGKIWGVIKGTSISEIVVSITRAGPRGTKLGPEKSINIPESKIQYEGLTSKDIVDLEFVGSHADIVGISFVRNVNDIVVLEQELKKRKLEHLGIVLKIETKDGLKNLAVMILEAMKLPNPLGIMIARGDLAVECGWEQMADIQEQILSICSAAHVPVIWATQVLESLVKTGVPTRAEITDVACGRRASCIMLNKGKHILEAIATLDTILKSSSSTKVKAEVKPLVLSNRLS
ncbi:putative pyruvate kinase [Helianthus annuus]|uniref:pyruvate kinase n=1 Tax=Helianthus annuus TaxID=4232 RepID=A0A251SNB2_HELAN|nr:plastidial pyruvate kinase 4, chloroplastic [Helianthus annuus]XP_022006752.1 plastidial pyruvate kinase 4, chloroplastic [Helianthus annuus]KAF5771440.1 putative pyruvate kinase [Helianthus annuus]KAJ0466287.1 putative pyruvate kinase [Helianthus annuus]KAJ0487848.1 putative pyruvate kinase [Helianthus annuus]KAJ0658319.1 putative pyruvate kinase [Helianthus annuus]KAJ0661981.1 putative pyruvate kinase [Helianthus annuus]